LFIRFIYLLKKISLFQLTDDECLSDDIFALSMNIFDCFVSKQTRTDHSLKLIALSCYNLAKKLRTSPISNKENERISSIFSEENYSDDEIFVNQNQFAFFVFVNGFSLLSECRTTDIQYIRLGFCFYRSSRLYFFTFKFIFLIRKSPKTLSSHTHTSFHAYLR